MKQRILITITLLGAVLGAIAQDEYRDHGRKLFMVEKLIENNYVEEVDTAAIVEDAIRAMLKRLDPHSSYSTPEETRALTEPLQGNFSGVGIQFQLIEDTLMVVQTTPGGPSEQVGIRPGDRLLSAGDSLLSGAHRNNADIRRFLRGPKGTTVDIRALRKTTGDTLLFRVRRDDIPIYSVDAAYIADPAEGIAYVRISNFAQDTPLELSRALKKLNRQGMRSLIIDLQDNGGGYLGTAIEMASMFLERNAPIVTTKGRSVPTMMYSNPEKGAYRDLPLVVLVNQLSASASEIFAGAVQDNDRGLVIGRRTFGKGLVQKPFPFPDGSMVRLTTSRYYTPSGRCVQRPYTPGDNDSYFSEIASRLAHGELMTADSIHIEGEDTTVYHTLRLGRPVLGGGGIIPDIFVPLDTTRWSTYYRDLQAKGLYNRLVAMVLDAEREQLLKAYPTAEAFAAEYVLPKEHLEQLIALGESEGVAFDPEGWAASGRMIGTLLKGLLARDLFDMAALMRVMAPEDPIYQRGIEELHKGIDLEQLNTNN